MVANKELVEQMTRMFAAQVTSFHANNDDFNEMNLDKPTNFVLASNGVFRLVETPIAVFKSKLADFPKDVTIPALKPMESGVNLKVPKIPFKYWLMLLTFYKDVNDKDGTEASALFFWNDRNKALPTKYEDDKDIHGVIEDGQLIIYCPKQVNQAGLSEFHDDGMVDWLRQNTTPLCETHSHLLAA